MPRVRYRPWMLYEEAVGLKNARRIAFTGFGVLAFNISLMMWMWAAFAGESRHISASEFANAYYNQYLEDKFENLYEAIRGDAPQFTPAASGLPR